MKTSSRWSIVLFGLLTVMLTAVVITGGMSGCSGGGGGGSDKTTLYIDADGDGYGSNASDAATIKVSTKDAVSDSSGTISATQDDVAYVSVNTDCDDSDENINPAMEDTAGDGTDQNCDGADEDAAGVSVPEPEPEPEPSLDTDDDGDGYTEEQDDCDDTNAAIYLGAAETVGDGVDSNCDGDDGTLADSDGDGVSYDDDCNDSDASITVASTYYADADGDGYGDGDMATSSCETSAPSGYTTDGSDCDDTSASVNPAVKEGFFYGNGGEVVSTSSSLINRLAIIQRAYAADDDTPAGYGNGINDDCDDEVDEEGCTCDDLTGYKSKSSTSWLNCPALIPSAYAADDTSSSTTSASTECDALISTFTISPGDVCDKESGGSGGTTRISPSTYAIDNGYMFFRGCSLDFKTNSNYELEEVECYLSDINDSGSTTRTISGTHHVMFNKMDETDEQYDWNSYASAVAFDGDTLKYSADKRSLNCGDTYYCPDDFEIDLDASDSAFKDWSLTDIHSGRYLFYVAVNGFEFYSDQKSSQLGELVAKAWIANENDGELCDVDKDSTGKSDGDDHCTLSDDLRIRVALYRKGESSHPLSGTVRYVLIGIDTKVWGAKQFEQEDKESGDSSDNFKIKKTLEQDDWAPPAEAQIIPVLSSWGFWGSPPVEVNKVKAWVRENGYNAASHEVTIEVHGAAEKSDGSDEIDPNYTDGWVLFCKSDDVCSTKSASATDQEDGGGADTKKTGDITVP